MDLPPPDPQPRPVVVARKRKELAGKERQYIVTRLLWELKEGDHNAKFGRGVLTAVAEEFNVTDHSIRRVWKRAVQSFENPAVRQLRASPRKKKNCGRKMKWNRDEVREAIKEIPLFRRRTIRDLAAALGIPPTTLFMMTKTDDDDDAPVIIPCSSALKPDLMPHHMLHRCEYGVSKLNPNDHMYDDFHQSVHVDEKWFFICEEKLHCYVVHGEELPKRMCQNKDHMIKVMFLCALARPRFAPNGECIFDGKIGMFPLIETVVAKRSTRNRPRGTRITRPVSVTKEKYRQIMITLVVPAIKEKSQCRNRNIVIQQDGASSHIDENDAAFVAAATGGVWNIKLETQPPKSPDLNVIDLSFFRALQSHQWRSGFANTIDELIIQVQRAYQTFPPRAIDYSFLTLQCCIDDILGIYGANDYAIRHMGKDALLRAGNLPTRIVAKASALATFNMFEGPAGGPDRVNNGENGDDDNALLLLQLEDNMQMIQQEAAA